MTSQGSRQQEPGGTCGARRADGFPCGQRAGSGTTHPGWGHCHWHRGALPPSCRRAELDRIGWAARNAAGALDLEVRTTPEDALDRELQRSEQMVAWVEQQLRLWPVDPDGNVKVAATTPGGRLTTERMPAVVALASHPALKAVRDLFMAERKHLTMVAKYAMDASLIDRKLALDEKRLDTLSEFIERVVTDLGMDPNDNAVRKVVAGRLRELAAS